MTSMSHAMRLFAVSGRVVPFGELRELVEETESGVALACLAGTNRRWVQLDLSYTGGPGVALIEREPASDRGAVAQEVEGILGAEDDEGHRPATAAGWVRQVAGSARAVYRFRVSADFARDREGREATDLVLNHLQASLGGVVYADAEGFYLLHDEIDWQVTWDPELTRVGVRGRRRMAVIEREEWVLFEMDSGRKAHREAFWQGRVPPGVVAAGRRPAGRLFVTCRRLRGPGR
jgi:hypothetical protein